MSLSLGVDLGGTKIEVVALDGQGVIVQRRRIATPQGDYRQSVQAIAGLVVALEDELGISGTVGIGVPGSISPTTGLIRNANSTCLNGKPLKQDVEQLLKRPVAVSNDANCFALSESTDGAAAGASSVFAVIIGTGTGSGM